MRQNKGAVCGQDTQIKADNLSERIRAREGDAYHDFAAEFRSGLMSFFRVRGLTREEAEDLADFCIDLIFYEKIDKYRRTETGTFTAWVYRVAKNEFVKWRRKYPKSTVFFDEDPSSHDYLEKLSYKESLFCHPDKESGEGDPNLTSALEDALTRISKKAGRFIRLRYLEDSSSYDDVCKTLGITRGNARVQNSRALDQLRDELIKDQRISTHSCYLNSLWYLPNTLTKLREAKQQIGFVPSVIGDYIRNLAISAKIPLPVVLKLFGIANLKRLEPGSAGPLACLAREIGLTLRETLIQARLSVVNQAEPSRMPLLSARFRAVGPLHDVLEECEARLMEIEASYSDQAYDKLLRIQANIRAEFDLPSDR